MLELKNICKSYGKKEVLHNFSVKFEKGIYGLLGPNGAGKSTLMNNFPLVFVIYSAISPFVF